MLASRYGASLPPSPAPGMGRRAASARGARLTWWVRSERLARWAFAFALSELRQHARPSCTRGRLTGGVRSAARGRARGVCQAAADGDTPLPCSYLSGDARRRLAMDVDRSRQLHAQPLSVRSQCYAQMSRGRAGARQRSRCEAGPLRRTCREAATPLRSAASSRRAHQRSGASLVYCWALV